MLSIFRRQTLAKNKITILIINYDMLLCGIVDMKTRQTVLPNCLLRIFVSIPQVSKRIQEEIFKVPVATHVQISVS